MLQQELEKKQLKKRYNNFDLIRLLLAVSVAITHIAILSGNNTMAEIGLLFSSELAVDAFFVISGFLIFMSFDSSRTVREFAFKRVRRILPGYATVIILCAIFLFFVSSKGVSDYYSIDWLKYLFFNLLTLNFFQPTLPGVFEHNYWSAVNGALWTIKIEVMFYAAVPLIAWILARTNKMRTLTAIYLLSVLYSFVMIWLAEHYESNLFMVLEKQLPGQLVFFITGAWLYYFQGIFLKNAAKIFLFSIFIVAIHLIVTELTLLYPAALGAVVIYLATVLRYLGDFGKFGDLSFGVYIWHFPIIQVYANYGLFDQPYVAIPLLIFTIFLAAYLSWHLIEKRFLSASSHYRTAEK